MKKFIIIIILALVQCACATPKRGFGEAATLLDFEAIGGEISVAYDDLSPQYENSQTVASIND